MKVDPKERFKLSKKSSILLLIIISVIGIFLVPGAVAAAGSGTNVYVSTSGNDSWDGLSSTFNSFSGSGPKATIKNATRIVATNGTIYLASGTYHENQINITSSMKIIGENKVNTFINGSNQGNLFNISEGVYLYLINLTITQGNDTNGGAINNKGTLTLKNTVFTNNTATKKGGAIYNTGTLTLDNTTFTENRATNGGDYSTSGGAIYNDGILIIRNSLFTANTALVYHPNMTMSTNGGAIYNLGTLTITNSTFTLNSAHQGGVITNDGNNTVTIDKCTFINNTSDGTGVGGAICNYYGVFTITNSVFTSNFAISAGAIYSYRGGLNVTNCTFKNNNATVNGGAIISSGETSIITDSTFTDNTARITGGAIAGGGDVLSGDRSQVLSPGSLTVINSIFTNNSATVGDGGAINAHNLNLINSILTGNNAAIGGAIFTNGISKITNSTIADNYAYLYGGGLFNSGNLNVIYSIISDNVGGSGGAFYNSEGTLTVISSIISGNSLLPPSELSPSGYGSAIFNFNVGEVYLEFNQIINSGGDYWVYSPHSRSVYADNNWWGDNGDPKTKIYINGRSVNSWLVLTPSIDKSVFRLGETVMVSVNLLYNNLGEYFDQAYGHVMDGITANLTSDLGIFSPSDVIFVNGEAKTMFTAISKGVGNIVATILGQAFTFFVQVIEGTNDTNNSNNTNTTNNSNNSTNSSTNSNSDESTPENPSPTENTQRPGDSQTPESSGGSPSGNNPQETSNGQTQGDTASSAAGESGETAGESGQNQKVYEVSTNTTGSNGSSQPETIVVAIIGVTLLLLLVGVGYYFKK